MRTIEKVLSYERKRLALIEEYYLTHKMDIHKLVENFPYDIVRIHICADSLDLSLAGDSNMLNEVVKYLRHFGLKTETYAESNRTVYNALFTKEDFSVWLFFTSTSCKRVKTGSRLEMVDTYEIICK